MILRIPGIQSGASCLELRENTLQRVCPTPSTTRSPQIRVSSPPELEEEVEDLVIVDDPGLGGFHGKREFLVEDFCPECLTRELCDALADPRLADA